MRKSTVSVSFVCHHESIDRSTDRPPLPHFRKKERTRISSLSLVVSLHSFLFVQLKHKLSFVCACDFEQQPVLSADDEMMTTTDGTRQRTTTTSTSK